MANVTIALPGTTFLRNVNGEAVNLDWAKVNHGVLPRILEVGAKVLLTNAYNGGGKEATDAEKLAAMMKKLDAWERGEFDVKGGGGGSLTGAMREAYVMETAAKHGVAASVIDKKIAETVKAAFGEKESATFPRFLDAVARQMGGKDEAKVADVRAKLEAKYAAAGQELLAARAKVATSIDLTDIEL